MSVANMIDTCPRDGNKVSHKTRELAEAELRRLGTPGLEVFPCRAAAGWHVGTIPKRTPSEDGPPRLAFSTVTPEPLTFRPTPADVKPLNGKAVTPVIDNSIESLLSAAESSGVAEAERLASEIRGLVAELVREVRIGQQERDLQAQIAELEAQRDAAITALRELRGEPEPVQSRAANFPPTEDQAAIRAWAREQTAKGVKGLEVKAHGQISLKVREAYDRAMRGRA